MRSETLSSLCLDTIHDVLLHRPNDDALRAAYVQATRARIEQGCRTPALVKDVAQHLWNEGPRHDALHYYAMLPDDPEARRLLANVVEARIWCLCSVQVVVLLGFNDPDCLAAWGVRFAHDLDGVYLMDTGAAVLSDIEDEGFRPWDSLDLDSIPETRLRWLLERTPGAQCELYASTLRAGHHGVADMEAFLKYEGFKCLLGDEIDGRSGYRLHMPSIDDLISSVQGIRLGRELIGVHNGWKLLDFVYDSLYVAPDGADRAVEVLLGGTRQDMSLMRVRPAAGVRVRKVGDDMLSAWLAARHLFSKVPYAL